MLRWAFIFLIIGLVLAALGFGGLAGASYWIAELLFVVAIVLFLLFLTIGIVTARKVKDAID